MTLRKISEILSCAEDGCPICRGELWVCENHADKAWPDECDCGAGMPCTCSPLHNDNLTEVQP